MKPTFVFLALFIASVVGIIAGYSDLSGLLSPYNWKRLFAAVPVLPAAAMLTAGAFAALLLAHWLCRGSKVTYNEAVFGCSYIAPFFIVLLCLPGAQTKPEWAPLNLYTMLIILCIAQVSATYALRDWFWSKGTPNSAI